MTREQVVARLDQALAMLESGGFFSRRLAEQQSKAKPKPRLMMAA